MTTNGQPDMTSIVALYNFFKTHIISVGTLDTIYTQYTLI